MSAPSHRPARPLVLALGAGLVLLAAGLWLAEGRLPSWSLADLPPRDDFVRSFRQAARQAGMLLEDGEPSVEIASRGALGDPKTATSSSGLVEVAVPDQVLVAVRGGATWNGGPPAELILGFSPGGELLLGTWHPADIVPGVPLVRSEPGSMDEVRVFATLLAPSGSELGESLTVAGLAAASVVFPLVGSDPPQAVEIIDPPGATLAGFRRSGNPAEADGPGLFSNLGRRVLSGILRLLFFLAVAGLFLAFLGRRRIDLANAWWLSGGTFAVLAASALIWGGGAAALLEGLVGAVVTALWILLLWSTAESWWRSLESEAGSSLDALRGGRLGPRGGRAILFGLAVGAALGGLRLALLVAAGHLSGGRLVGLSVPLPVFSATGSPLTEGVRLAALVLLAAVLALRWLPRRWALPSAAVAAAVLVQPLPVEPYPAALAGGVLLTGALVAVFQHFELTGLLVAAVTLLTLPAVVFSARHLDWMPGTFALTAAGLAALVGVAVVGLRRSEDDEVRGMRAPAFVRRLADERRLQHEMGLLARMQLGLLPTELPVLPNWEISARSVLATEVGGDLYDFTRDGAGRLWVAAGDVSGHGYSCAIVHAMTKAALVSLVDGERTPAQVLSRVDRVLRSVQLERAFTSLTLLCLNPETGEGLLANAGHPFPLLWSRGEVREVEVAGLPLGQGPPRDYEDHGLEVPPGSVLVLCSDGLFEATDRDVEPYGFDRPRRLLAHAARWPSNEILEMMLADWRRHRGAAAAADDTTVVVLKHLAGLES